MATQTVNDLTFPWVTEFPFICGAFFAALLVFHAVFIYRWPRGSAWWKTVDYVWLSMALVGLLGSVGAGRELVARNNLDIAHQRLKFSYESIGRRLKDGASEVLCRPFVRSEYSPPPDEFERDQRTNAEQCAYFNKALKLLPPEAPATDDLNVDAMFGPFPIGQHSEPYVALKEEVSDYNGLLAQVRDLERQGKPTELESFVKLIGPLLLAVALALRMTKVTADIRADQSKQDQR